MSRLAGGVCPLAARGVLSRLADDDDDGEGGDGGGGVDAGGGRGRGVAADEAFARLPRR